LCSEELDRILRTMGFDVLDVVPVRRQNLPGKCEVLRRMGEQLVDGSVQGFPHTSAGGKKAEERKG
ncbi:MAG TPA: hypothetical protein DCX07_05160, partial [Phycisphaerales bacterium]|nr:hypothetical protein [Phycisphaerales bacterium]